MINNLSFSFPDLLWVSSLALRVVVGIIFIVHSKQKFSMWKVAPSDQMPASMINLMRFLSVAEMLGGIAVLIGFLTQLASIGLAIIMLGAIYFKIKKWQAPFFAKDKTGWEFDLMVLAGLIALFFLGTQQYGIDPLIFKVASIC
jgi:putative oxidoreductase